MYIYIYINNIYICVYVCVSMCVCVCMQCTYICVSVCSVNSKLGRIISI